MVSRPRLLEQLREAMQFPVALIVAPAGFGKTTLVTQYLSGSAGPLVRFDVRRSHATLAGFVRGFAEALETQLPALRSALRQGAAPAAGSNAPAVELADWLHAHLRDFAGLVAIDDLHVASDPEVGKLVALLVERAPRTQRWLIATRDASQLPVASWVGAGRAQMPIEESDLRFNVDEATELVAHADLAVDPGEVRAFANLMRGWPTGLALALHGSTDTENLRKIASETREFIFRYLTEQVFSELGEREQTFLLDAAVYPVVRIRWMNKAGYDDAMLLLNRLRAKIAFVERTGDDSYRLHDLFGEFLEAQLQLRGEAIFRDAVRRAAQVLKNEGESEEALVAYTRAADERGIAHLLEAEGFELIERGAQDLVGIALASLPAEIIADRPRLIACDAFLESHRGRFAAVAVRFRNAIASETDPRSRAEIGYRYAAKAFASPLADEAMQTLRSLDRKNLPVSLQASIVSLLGYYDAVSRDFPAAREQLARARDLIESVDDGALRAMILARSASAAYLGGEHDDALRFATAAMEEGARYRAFGASLLAQLVLVAHSADVRDDLRLALDGTAALERTAAQLGNATVGRAALIARFDIEAVRGNEEALARLEARLNPQAALDWGLSNMSSAFFALALRAAGRGDFRTAYDLLARTTLSFTHVDGAAQRFSEIAFFAAAAGLPAEAEVALAEAASRLAPRAEAWTPQKARALVHLGAAYTMLGQRSAANGAITQVEREQHRFGQGTRALIHAARALYVRADLPADADGSADAFAELRAVGFGGYAKIFERCRAPSDDGEAARFARLTGAELGVLRKLVSGATNKTIAADLGRSVRTVELHVAAIIAKLRVRNRGEAIRVATQEGLTK